MKNLLILPSPVTGRHITKKYSSLVKYRVWLDTFLNNKISLIQSLDVVKIQQIHKMNQKSISHFVIYRAKKK